MGVFGRTTDSMWLLLCGFLAIFFLVWLAIFADHSVREPQFNGSVDVMVAEFYAHALCWPIILVCLCFSPVSPEIFDCPWEYIITGCFIVHLIKGSINSRIDPSSMIIRLIVNMEQLLKSILFFRALIYLWDVPLIWPVVVNHGWTGDFRGIFLFVLPVYNFMFVANNPTLSVIPVVVGCVSLVLHMFVYILGMNWAIYQSVGIWASIFVLNVFSLLWSVPDSVENLGYTILEFRN